METSEQMPKKTFDIKGIERPYNPEGFVFSYLPADHPWMVYAKEFARTHSQDKVMPNASLFVVDGEIVAAGANGSNYHELHGCERVRKSIPTGQGYELCDGCHPKNHGEQKAIINAQNKGVDIRGARIVLWGHFWLCKPCCDALREVGVSEVFLLEDSEILFNKNVQGNIVGRQFE